MKDQRKVSTREGEELAERYGVKFLETSAKEGVNIAEVTLHVGLGTFRSIEVEDLSKHKMDAEYFKVDEHAVKIVNKAKETMSGLKSDLFYHSTHDSLTGLLNRREFEITLVKAVEDSHLHGTEHILCYLDLDFFMLI